MAFVGRYRSGLSFLSSLEPVVVACGMPHGCGMALATAVSARHSRLKTLFSPCTMPCTRHVRVASRFIDIVSLFAGRENDRGCGSWASPAFWSVYYIHV